MGKKTLTHDEQSELDHAVLNLRDIYQKYQENSASLIQYGQLDCRRSYFMGRVAYYMPETDIRGPWNDTYFKHIPPTMPKDKTQTSLE